MAASKPTSWSSTLAVKAFSYAPLGTLTDDLGCCPFDPRPWRRGSERWGWDLVLAKLALARPASWPKPFGPRLRSLRDPKKFGADAQQEPASDHSVVPPEGRKAPGPTGERLAELVRPWWYSHQLG